MNHLAVVHQALRLFLSRARKSDQNIFGVINIWSENCDTQNTLVECHGKLNAKKSKISRGKRIGTNQLLKGKIDLLEFLTRERRLKM